MPDPTIDYSKLALGLDALNSVAQFRRGLDAVCSLIEAVPVAQQMEREIQARIDQKTQVLAEAADQALASAKAAADAAGAAIVSAAEQRAAEITATADQKVRDMVQQQTAAAEQLATLQSSIAELRGAAKALAGG